MQNNDEKNPMYRDKALVSGTNSSTELTESQRKLTLICAYFGKVALTISQTPVSTRILKPNAHQEMLNAIKAAGKEPEDLTPKEWEKYEKEKYEFIEDQPLGGQSNYLQFLLLELSNSAEFRKLMEAATKEAANLAEKQDMEIFTKQTDDASLT